VVTVVFKGTVVNLRDPEDSQLGKESDTKEVLIHIISHQHLAHPVLPRCSLPGINLEKKTHYLKASPQHQATHHLVLVAVAITSSEQLTTIQIHSKNQ
jgi:hypothetical protein